ncbi:hypothetical protein BJ322DRAFT_1021891 [Thelephora terrestris]|uniref:Uncharacterized protein n=1 Tax=Thelephora terrestris TaxID=56493 RepID=A0A9P6HCD5_9AGAM|nr:hypothetical protein BJ322DRAFT_1021891 [Thelephora terrestris]
MPSPNSIKVHSVPHRVGNFHWGNGRGEEKGPSPSRHSEERGTSRLERSLTGLDASPARRSRRCPIIDRTGCRPKLTERSVWNKLLPLIEDNRESRKFMTVPCREASIFCIRIASRVYQNPYTPVPNDHTSDFSQSSVFLSNFMPPKSPLWRLCAHRNQVPKTGSDRMNGLAPPERLVPPNELREAPGTRTGWGNQRLHYPFGYDVRNRIVISQSLANAVLYIDSWCHVWVRHRRSRSQPQ